MLEAEIGVGAIGAGEPLATAPIKVCRGVRPCRPLGCQGTRGACLPGWKNWKRTIGVLCDRKNSARVKGKVFKSVVRPAMLYSAETWPIKMAQESKLEVAEMRMLRWMLGVTKEG